MDSKYRVYVKLYGLKRKGDIPRAVYYSVEELVDGDCNITQDYTSRQLANTMYRCESVSIVVYPYDGELVDLNKPITFSL